MLIKYAIGLAALTGQLSANYCLDKEDPIGLKYNGTWTRSKSGYLCMNWADMMNTNHMVPYDVDPILFNHNYCRNPESSVDNFDVEGPWCWTASTKDHKSWQYWKESCGIETCAEFNANPYRTPSHKSTTRINKDLVETKALFTGFIGTIEQGKTTSYSGNAVISFGREEIKLGGSYGNEHGSVRSRTLRIKCPSIIGAIVTCDLYQVTKTTVTPIEHVDDDGNSEMNTVTQVEYSYEIESHISKQR